MIQLNNIKYTVLIIFVLIISACSTSIQKEETKTDEEIFLFHYNNMLNEGFEYKKKQTLYTNHNKKIETCYFESKNYKVYITDAYDLDIYFTYNNDNMISLDVNSINKYNSELLGNLMVHIITNNKDKFTNNLLILALN